ncbi:ABC transporter ATP-binding protein [Alkaliphilus peptidifermentans]|uniref:Oligopeptide transport system ATP-binding protein n=1 Tax=Alkaliphilus peptidifermentans DSM 18978 TaxID=1120976 RepID=A0A1G5L2X8_9FIRM|nr:ABC transporter ATP-binding protein [Alkaliphilus peptidifermentans]SCZ06791.1 oligopeptide transport system ATP-binding protein [Alkaliphilus peptidifermentans DSM 18978]
MAKERILEVENLTVAFKTYGGSVQAVRGTDFYLDKGETLAIVGESGCGKTVTAKAIMGLLPIDNTTIGNENSKIMFNGRNLIKLTEGELADLRGKEISMIFQDPMTSLNPTMRIGEQIAESVLIHNQISKEKAKEIAIKMLKLVQIPNPEERYKQYPFEFSGGMRQRVMIAIALACDPKILIADEPTTALDVTIQAQIMKLINELKKDLDTGVILVTHDLGVVAGAADRIIVMYAGKIVESGRTEDIFYNLKHPYTYALLQSVPKLTKDTSKKLYSLQGTPPDLIDPPKGCGFAPRCDFAMKICSIKTPEKTTFAEGHEAYCWLHHEKANTQGVPELILTRGESSGK